MEDFERNKQPESKDSKSASIDIENPTEVMAKISHKPTKATPQKIKKKTTATEENKVERTKTKMGKSSSTEIRLRGKYLQATVEQREHTKLLQNKLSQMQKSKSRVAFKYYLEILLRECRSFSKTARQNLLSNNTF